MVSRLAATLVRRLMRQMGLQAVDRRPKTSQPHPAHPIYPYLLKDLEITRPNQVWCVDITFDGKSNLDLFLCRLTNRQPRISVSRGDHGLGDAQGVLVWLDPNTDRPVPCFSLDLSAARKRFAVRFCLAGACDPRRA